MVRGRQTRLQIGGDATTSHTALLLMYLMGAHCTGLESVFTIRPLTGLNRKTCVVGSLRASLTLGKGIDQEAIVLMLRCISFAPKGAATN